MVNRFASSLGSRAAAAAQPSPTQRQAASIASAMAQRTQRYAPPAPPAQASGSQAGNVAFRQAQPAILSGINRLRQEVPDDPWVEVVNDEDEDDYLFMPASVAANAPDGWSVYGEVDRQNLDFVTSGQNELSIYQQPPDIQAAFGIAMPTIADPKDVFPTNTGLIQTRPERTADWDAYAGAIPAALQSILGGDIADILNPGGGVPTGDTPGNIANTPENRNIGAIPVDPNQPPGRIGQAPSGLLRSLQLAEDEVRNPDEPSIADQARSAWDILQMAPVGDTTLGEIIDAGGDLLPPVMRESALGVSDAVNTIFSTEGMDLNTGEEGREAIEDAADIFTLEEGGLAAIPETFGDIFATIGSGFDLAVPEGLEDAGNIFLDIVDFPSEFGKASRVEAVRKHYAGEDLNPLEQAYIDATQAWIFTSKGLEDIPVLGTVVEKGENVGPQDFGEWMLTNPEAFEEAYEQGGHREVWETYQRETTGEGWGGLATRFLRDVNNDPLTALPVAGAAAKAVGGLGRATRMRPGALPVTTAAGRALETGGMSAYNVIRAIEMAADLGLEPAARAVTRAVQNIPGSPFKPIASAERANRAGELLDAMTKAYTTETRRAAPVDPDLPGNQPVQPGIVEPGMVTPPASTATGERVQPQPVQPDPVQPQPVGAGDAVRAGAEDEPLPADQPVSPDPVTSPDGTAQTAAGVRAGQEAGDQHRVVDAQNQPEPPTEGDGSIAVGEGVPYSDSVTIRRAEAGWQVETADGAVIESGPWQAALEDAELERTRIGESADAINLIPSRWRANIADGQRAIDQIERSMPDAATRRQFEREMEPAWRESVDRQEVIGKGAELPDHAIETSRAVFDTIGTAQRIAPGTSRPAMTFSSRQGTGTPYHAAWDVIHQPWSETSAQRNYLYGGGINTSASASGWQPDGQSPMRIDPRGAQRTLISNRVPSGNNVNAMEQARRYADLVEQHQRWHPDESGPEWDRAVAQANAIREAIGDDRLISNGALPRGRQTPNQRRQAETAQREGEVDPRYPSEVESDGTITYDLGDGHVAYVTPERRSSLTNAERARFADHPDAGNSRWFTGHIERNGENVTGSISHPSQAELLDLLTEEAGITPRVPDAVQDAGAATPPAEERPDPYVDEYGDYHDGDVTVESHISQPVNKLQREALRRDTLEEGIDLLERWGELRYGPRSQHMRPGKRRNRSGNLIADQPDVLDHAGWKDIDRAQQHVAQYWDSLGNREAREKARARRNAEPSGSPAGARETARVAEDTDTPSQEADGPQAAGTEDVSQTVTPPPIDADVPTPVRTIPPQVQHVSRVLTGTQRRRRKVQRSTDFTGTTNDGFLWDTPKGGGVPLEPGIEALLLDFTFADGTTLKRRLDILKDGYMGGKSLMNPDQAELAAILKAHDEIEARLAELHPDANVPIPLKKFLKVWDGMMDFARGAILAGPDRIIAYPMVQAVGNSSILAVAGKPHRIPRMLTKDVWAARKQAKASRSNGIGELVRMKGRPKKEVSKRLNEMAMARRRTLVERMHAEGDPKPWKHDPGTSDYQKFMAGIGGSTGREITDLFQGMYTDIDSPYIVERMLRKVGTQDVNLGFAGKLFGNKNIIKRGTYFDGALRHTLGFITARSKYRQTVPDFRNYVSDRVQGWGWDEAKARQVWDAFWDGLDDGTFSADELYRHYRENGLDEGRAMRLHRDWQSRVNKIEKETRAEIRRVSFAGDETRADLFLKRVTLFHYFFTRQAYFFGMQMARHPFLINAYFDLQDELAQYAEDHDGIVPDWMKGWVGLLGGPFGLNVFANLVNPFQTYLLFRNDADFRVDKITDLGSFIQEVDNAIGLNPWIMNGLNMFGFSGDTFAPDPLYLWSEASKLTTIINLGRAHGWFPTGPNPVGNLYEDWMSEARELFSGWMPGSEDIDATSSVGAYNREVHFIAIDEAQQMGRDPLNDEQDAIWVLEQLQDPESELYQRAVKRWSAGEAVTMTLQAVLAPFRIRTRQGMTSEEGEDIGVGIDGTEMYPDLVYEAQRQNPDAAFTIGNTTDPAALEIAQQQMAYQNLGTEDQRRMNDIYTEIVYGTVHYPVVVGGKEYSAAEVTNMSQEQRQKLGLALLQEYDLLDDWEGYKDAQDQFLGQEENREYATYLRWRDEVYDYPGGPTAYFEEAIASDNGNARLFFEATLANNYYPKRMDTVLASPDGYMAVKGIGWDAFAPDLDEPGEDPVGIANQAARPTPYEPYVPPTTTTLLEDADELNGKLQNWDGESDIYVPSSIQKYLAWRNEQPAGTDTSLDAYIAWSDAQYDAGATERFEESLQPQMSDDEALDVITDLWNTRQDGDYIDFDSGGFSGGGGGSSSGASGTSGMGSFDWLFG